MWFIKYFLFFVLAISWVEGIALGDSIAPASSNPNIPAFQQGLNLLEKGQYAEAQAAFAQVLNTTPNHIGSLVGSADAYQKTGNFKQARVQLEQALKLDPKNGQVQQAWGRFLWSQKNFVEAEAAFLQASALMPETSGPLLDLGQLYLSELKKPASAQASFEKVLAMDPQNFQAQFGVGTALTLLGKWPEAKQALTKAGGLADSHNPMPWFSLGAVNYETKNYDAALEDLSKAIAIQPTFALAYEKRGDVYMAKGIPQKAVLEYEKTVLLQPRVATPQIKLALAYQETEQFQKANDTWLQIITLDPNNATVYNNLAWLAVEHNHNLDQALSWATKAVTLSPKDGGFHDTLAWVHRAQGNLAQAEVVLEKARSLAPQDPQILYHLGIVLQEGKKPKEARQLFSEAIAVGKPFPGLEDAKKRLNNSQKS